MFNRNYKRGAADAMQAYEDFAKKQEAATRRVGEQIGILSDDVSQLGENVAFISDYITDKEKQALYKANMPVDIMDLEKTDKYLLVAILYELAQEEQPTEEQKNYIRAVQKYLNIREVQRDIDLGVVEAISDSATTIAIMQAVMEYFYLGTHPGAYTEDELDFLDCFMANRRTRKEIVARIQAIVNAVGKEGLAEKYGFVPDEGEPDTVMGSGYYPPTAEIADMVPLIQESNGIKEIVFDALFRVLETDNYLVYQGSGPIVAINKRSGETKTLQEEYSLYSHLIYCGGDSIVVGARQNLYVYEIDNDNSHYIPAYGKTSPESLCVSEKYYAFNKDSWYLHVSDYISGQTWEIRDNNNESVKAESAYIVGDSLYFLRIKDYFSDETALCEYNLVERKFIQNCQMRFDGRCGRIVVHNQKLYAMRSVTKESIVKPWYNVFVAPLDELGRIKEQGEFSLAYWGQPIISRTGKVIHRDDDDKDNLYVYDLETNRLIRIDRCKKNYIHVIGSFVYYMNNNNSFRFCLDDMKYVQIAP